MIVFNSVVRAECNSTSPCSVGKEGINNLIFMTLSFDKILVLFLGIFSAAFTFWFFFMKKSKKVVEVNEEIKIIVDGGYNPGLISVPVGKTTKIIFFRKDPSSCLEEVVMSDFKIKKYLPLNQEVMIEITPKIKGEFEIVCGMNMFHGKVIVK